MKKLLHLIFPFLVCLFTAKDIKAQCAVDAYAKNGANQVKTINIDCGQTVKIGAVGDAGQYVLAFSENFNSGTLASGWNIGSTSYSIGNPPCQEAGDNWNGTFVAWICDNTTDPRSLQTTNFDVRLGGKVRYKMKYAFQPLPTAATCCETPDAAGEGVSIQYSIDGGTVWTDIPGSYKDPNGGNDPVLTKWQQYEYFIPIEANTTSTIFRFYQGNSTGVDHWGIDDFEILLNDPKFKYEWSHLPNFNGATPPPVSPGTSTTYVVTYRDTVGNTCLKTSSVQVNVANNNTIESHAEVPVLCPSGTTKMVTTSNMFAPTPNFCGVASVGGCPIGYTNDGVKQVGTGTIKNSYNDAGGVNPFGDFGQDACASTQIIYRAAELIAAGLKAGYISSVAYNILAVDEQGGAGAYKNFSISMGCTGTNAFTTSNSQVGLPVTAVYNRATQPLALGWQTFNFDRAYAWDGVTNIVVQICWYNTVDETGDWSAKTQDHNPGFNAMIQTNSNFSNGNCNIEFPTDYQAQRPNTRFGLCLPTPSPNIRFEWTPPATLDNPNKFDPVASPTATTSYTVKIYDVNFPQCFVTDTANVIVKPNPVATITGPTTRCVREGLTLTAGTNPVLPGTTFTWTKNGAAIAGGGTLVDNPVAGTHTYTVTPRLNGCTGTPATRVVTVNPDPIPPVVQPQLVCNSEEATHTITNSASFVSTIKFDWTGPTSFASTTAAPQLKRNPSVAGGYTVVARDTITGCFSNTTNFNVSTNPSPPTPTISTNSPICPGSTLNLNGTTTERTSTYTNNGATAGNYTASRTTYGYTYQWSGPGTINNGTTKNANSPAVGVGNYSYTFIYRESITVFDTTCTIVPIAGKINCVPTSSSVTCPSNIATAPIAVTALPTVTGRTATCVDSTGMGGTENAYRVQFNVNGGVPGYTSTSTLPNPGIGGTFAGNSYTSNFIRFEDSTYSFTVTDSRNCPGFTVSGLINCSVPQPPPCTSSIGNFPGSTTNKSVCGFSTPMSFVYDNTLDGGSNSPITFFLIHDGSYTGATTNIIDIITGTTNINITWNPTKYDTGVTYTITPIRSLDDGTGRPDFNYSCLDIAPGRTFLFNALPSANITAVPAQVCNGGSSKLGLNFIGVGPFDVIINNGTSNATYTNMTFGDTIPVSPLVNTTYTITNVLDKSTNPSCSNTSGLGSTSVSLAGSPRIGAGVQYECNANNDAYKVRFGITQGDESTYKILQTDGITLVSGNYDATLDSFYSSEWVNSGSSFTYQVTDGNNCSPKLITRTFACACSTDAGTMASTSIVLCPSESTLANIHNGDQVLDGNDVLMFVLHQGSSNSIVSPIDTSDSPVFAYEPTKMAFNRDYYISPIAGNAMSGSPLIVDPSDPCRSIKSGFKVSWKEGPIASVAVVDDKLCVGDTTFLNLNIIGNNPPYTLVYSNGIEDITVVSNSSSTQYQINGVQNDSTYVLKSVSDGQCSGLLAVDKAEFEVFQFENATFDYLEKNLCVDGGLVSNVTNIPLTSGGFYVPNSSDLNVDQSKGTVNPALSKPGNYTISYRTVGFCPDTHTVSFTIVDSLKTPVFTYSNNGIYCENETSGLFSFVTPGTPSNGAYTYTRVAPTPAGNTINLNPNGNLDIVNSNPGTYNVTYRLTSTQGCLAKQFTRPVTIKQAPDATFGYDILSACLDGGVDPILTSPLTTGGVYTVSPASGLAFNNGNIIVGSSVPNTYTISYYADNTQCKDTFSVDFQVLNGLPIPEFHYTKQGYCQGEGNQSIAFANGSIPSNGSWSYTRVAPTPANSLLSFNPTNGTVIPSGSSPGVYEVNYLIKKPGCADKGFAENIFIYEEPRANVLVGIDNCVGRIVDVNYLGSAPVGSSYAWFMGNNSEPRQYAGKGPHKVIWKSAGLDSVRVVVNTLDGCIDTSDFRTVNILEKSEIASISASEPFPIKLQARENKAIQFFSNVTGVTDYYWEFGDGTYSSEMSPVHSYENVGLYNVKLTVSNSSICFDTASKGSIIVEDFGAIASANAFSPNRDGQNEYFLPTTEGVQYYNLKIFNRWGQLMYSGNENDQGWDGLFDGKEAPDGVYVYVIEGRTYAEEFVKKLGTLTLTR